MDMENITVTMSKAFYESVFGPIDNDNEDSPFVGAYNHRYVSSSGSTLPSSYLPRIINETTMENPFGSNLSNARTIPIIINKNNGTLTIKGGWSHYSLGNCPYDIVFDMGFDEDGKFDGTFTSRNEIVFSNGAVFESYVLTKFN